MKKNYFSYFSRNKLKAALSGFAIFAAAGLNAQLITQTFNFTESMQTFVVPACVSNVTIITYGAEGVGSDGFIPGKGGAAKGVLAVTAGQVLNIFVGGQDGYNGGGLGKGVANGGGGSDVRMGGVAFANRIIVAGGGGGAGGDSWQCNVGTGDGGGGTAVGANFMGGAGGAGYEWMTGCGTDGGNSGGIGGNGYHGGGGGGGGFTSGGTGACALQGCGQTGALGLGGDAHMNSNCNNTGGGGGGYYGGGGAAGENCGAGRGGGGSSWTGVLTTPGFTAGAQSGDGKVVLIYNLINPVIGAKSNNTTICPGTNVTLTGSSVVSYTWNPGNQIQSSIVVTPNQTTTYTLQGTNSIGCISQVLLTVTVFPYPPVVASNTNSFLCMGQTATLSASGVNSYTWMNGAAQISTAPSITVSPLVTTNYMLLVTSTVGCTYTINALTTVNTNSLTVSANTLVCAGKQVALSASGANTYNWTNPSWPNGIPFASTAFVPNTASVYTVTGVDANNCTLTNTVSVGIYTVAPVVATANRVNVCTGELVDLKATGADTYLWNTGATGSLVTINVVANLPVTYSVTGTDVNGCKAKSTVVVNGYFCLGLNEIAASGISLNVYPNPNAGSFQIKSEIAVNLTIVNTLGQHVKTVSIPDPDKKASVEGLSSGIYFITGESNGQKFAKKVIVQ